MKVKNVQGISRIVLTPKAICFCPLGNDWYTNEFTITLEPSDYFPDYCDVEKWMDENIRGKSLIIEDAINNLYTYFEEEYKPLSLTVSSFANSRVHAPVTVTK